MCQFLGQLSLCVVALREGRTAQRGLGPGRGWEDELSCAL